MRRYLKLRSRDAATGITRLASNDMAVVSENGVFMTGRNDENDGWSSEVNLLPEAP